jgi:hypothetical protein
MTARADAIAAALEPDQRQTFKELVEDYNAAAKLHVPNWLGGMNLEIAAELVRSGWSKKAKSK